MPDERDVAKVAVSPEWRNSINFAILTLLQLVVCGFVTFLLLLLLPKASQPPIEKDPNATPGPHEENRDARVVRIWATALGLLSTLLALFQYLVRSLMFPYCMTQSLIRSISSAANCADMAQKARRLPQHTNDVHSDAGFLRICVLPYG